MDRTISELDDHCTFDDILKKIWFIALWNFIIHWKL